MTTPKLIQVGMIASAHGVRGELKLRSFTADPLSLLDYQPLLDAKGEREFSFTLRGEAKGQLIVRIKGVDDRNEAEKLAGIELFIPRDRLPENGDEDDFFIEDLIGLEVRLVSGAHYGHIKQVMNFGAGDIVEITPRHTKKTELYPFTKASFPTIHIHDGYVMLDAPEAIIVKEENTR